MSIFDGTWRPDVQRPGPDAPIEELRLRDGVYACVSCEPSYEVAADGQPQRVEGAAWFDSLAVTIVDARTVRRVASRAGEVVLDATTVLSPFGHTKRETRRQLRSDGGAFEFAVTSRRVGAAGVGAAAADGHALTGRWQPIEADLPNHEEDTTYRLVDGVLSMRDGFGRSFDAPVDGATVPYHGDPRFTTVRVREIDDRTLEEVDANGSDVVLTTRWQVDPDGRTMHVRFEHADGRVQEQDGRRLD